MKPNKPVQKLPPAFYTRYDVLQIAQDLLGKILVTDLDGRITSGRIVETEAYAGETDKASHAYKGITPRTKVMFGEGGQAYVYLCYGIHQMFNVVTAKEGVAHAILIRAVEPLSGIDVMIERTGAVKWENSITKGPGKVGKAFGFHTSQTGLSLQGDEIYIADDGFSITDDNIVATPRIGVAYAGDHAEWPYRFYLKGNKYVSGKNTTGK